ADGGTGAVPAAALAGAPPWLVPRTQDRLGVPAGSILTVSGDLWDLFYLNYSNLQSRPLLTAVLAGMHDPEHLGMRVLCELLGVSLGVYLGWVLSGGYRARDVPARHP